MKNSLLKKKFASYAYQLTFLMLIGFSAHRFLLVQMLKFQDSIAPGAYAISFVVSLMFLFVLVCKKDKIHDKISYFFVASSFLKFVLFRVFYIESFLENTFGLFEFTSFFIPYAITLFMEIYAVIQVLHEDEEHKV